MILSFASLMSYTGHEIKKGGRDKMIFRTKDVQQACKSIIECNLITRFSVHAVDEVSGTGRSDDFSSRFQLKKSRLKKGNFI